MLPIFKKEIWGRKYSLLAYGLIGCILIWVYVALYPSIQASAVQFEKLYQSFPKGMYEAMGIQELSLDTLEKFLSVELFSFMWPILAILLVLSRAGGSIAGEIEKGTIGLTLSLPINRFKIFLSKYAAALASMIIFILFTITSIILIAAPYHLAVNKLNNLKLSFLCLLFMWAIYAMAMFLSAAFSERNKVYMVMGGLLVVMYATNVIATLQTNLRWLHKTSIFYYFNPQGLLSHGVLNVRHLMVLAVVIAVFTILGFITFSKRDITT